MAKTHTSGGNMPTTCQEKYSGSGTDTQPSTAIPRCTEYDLDQVGQGEGCRGEGTYRVTKRGNQVTGKGGNF